MKLSKFGEKFSGPSGIVELMDDLGTALNENPEMIFMGGGNPGRIPEVEQIFKARLETVLADPAQLHTLLGVYQSPQGDKDFREQIAGLLKQQFGWDLSERNIAVPMAVSRRSLYFTTCLPERWPMVASARFTCL